MLLIPPEFKKEVNGFSGYINPNSIYHEKNLKGLFLSPPNRKYLAKELYALLTCRTYVMNNLPHFSIHNSLKDDFAGDHEMNMHPDNYDNPGPYPVYDKTSLLVDEFKKRKSLIMKSVNQIIEQYQFPHKEDFNSLNPIQQLHNVNMDFLLINSRNIIQNPQNVIPYFDRISPDTGKVQVDDYEYSAISYSDGAWHPEQLFTESARNRENPYWVPYEVNISSNADAKGTGHKYNNYIYNWGTYDRYKSDHDKYGNPKPPMVGGPKYGPIPLLSFNDPGAQNQKMYEVSYGQFPGWQYTVNNRPYDRHDYPGINEGLRTVSPRAYDMEALFRNPH